ncbi:MAG TPA: hypothetical protein VHC96_22650 [Puia sp.]|jgi:hypothetical protein|nr:hypothetical protein [Puia sp.]
MLFQRYFLFVTLSCLFTMAGRGQAPSWKSLQLGVLSLKYPPTWVMEKTHGKVETYVVLTPDSMRSLPIKVLQIIELPVIGDHTYARFKKDFATMLTSNPDWPTKILKTEEISFKGHKTMYAEIIRSSLRGKVYGINTGGVIYAILLLQSRHVGVPDPKMERDGAAILDSITFD